MTGTTDDPADPRLTHGEDDAPVPQADVYLVLSEAERAAGFIRPLRFTYQHTGGCGARTTMGQPIAETYARQPNFYGATYCVGCRMHRPVGVEGEFHWIDSEGRLTNDKVGT